MERALDLRLGTQLGLSLSVVLLVLSGDACFGQASEDSVKAMVENGIEAEFQRTIGIVKELEDVNAAVPYEDCGFAMRRLEEMLDERCLPTMVKILKRKEPVKYRGYGGSPGSAPPLVIFQCLAIEIIKGFGDLEYLPLVEKIQTDDQHGRVKLRAEEAIAELKAKIPKAPVVVDSLLRALLQNSVSEERHRNVLNELKGVYRLWAIPTVLEYTGKKHPLLVREKAISRLGAIGGYRAIMPLVELLSDEDESVRAQAATVLGSFGYEVALPALENSLNDPSEKVRKAASRAIEFIEGRNRHGPRRLR